MSTGTARYAREHGNWFLKLGGDLRHTLAPSLYALLERMFADSEPGRVVVDLSEAENIDSTCLGILARIGSRETERSGPKPTIVSTREDINAVLQAMCFDRFFDIVDANGAFSAEMQPLPETDTDTDSMLELVLDAHRRLCAIDARTNDVFRDVVDALENEAAQKQRSG